MSDLTPQEKRGKQFYQKGEAANGEAIALLSGNLELPAASFPCSNCHGLRGEGGNEGGLQPPPLDWASLTSRHTSALTRNERPPYNEATLARAISSGVDSSGARLHPGMPRYRMAATQMADLIAYLKKVGNEADREPGLSDDAIRVGAALPMTSTLARFGEDVKAVLGAYFTAINSQGGIYGRKVELVVEDSQGTERGTAEATRRLIEQDQVFALVGSFQPTGKEVSGEFLKQMNEFLKRVEVPLIGPVTLSQRAQSVPNRFVFYLLPSFADQASVLVDFINMDPTRPKDRPSRLAVVYRGGYSGQDALEGIRSQAKLYSMPIVYERDYMAPTDSWSTVLAALVSAKPDYVFYFGGADEFTYFALEMDRAGLESRLLSSAIMVGRIAFAIPPALARRTYLSYPTVLPNKDDYAEFLSSMQKAGVELRSAPLQALAFASAKIFVEATKDSGRQITRSSLIASLERLQGFRTGVVPPVTFGPNRRIGNAGSYIVGLDLNRKEFIPLTGLIVPKRSLQ